jgi:hypothetical protein
MSFNGSGVFDRLYSWTNDALAGIKIRADRMDNEMNGMATGLSTCITKNGQTTITANLPMAGYRHTGVGAAAARTDYAQGAQVTDGVLNWAVAGGTANALTASYTLSTTTLKDGQLFYVRATAANSTTTPTFSPDGLTARTITTNGGAALPVGAWAANSELVFRYNLANTRYEYLGNNAVAAITSGAISGVTINNSAIGGTTPAAGAFTTFTATTSVVGGGSSTGAVSEVSKAETTAYNGAATDGQLTAGSTLVVTNAAASNTALAQLVFAQRVGSGGYHRIVATGGSVPSLRTVVNNVEVWNEVATNSALATRLQVGAPTAAASPAVGDVNAKRLLVEGVAVPFIRSYTSSDQVLTLAAQLVLPHSLAATPRIVQLELVCQSAEGNYSVNDVVVTNPSGNDTNGAGSAGFSVVTDSTNITIRVGSSSIGRLLDKTTGAAFATTAANWRLRVKAYTW